MNGRVYDYNLGKFMSVDPFIQSPTNSQSFNPYSYIMNNPLAGTDPTGYTSDKVEVETTPPDNSETKVNTVPNSLKCALQSVICPTGVTGNGANGGSGDRQDRKESVGQPNSSTNQDNNNSFGSYLWGGLKRIAQRLLEANAEAFWGEFAHNAEELADASEAIPINGSEELAGAAAVDASPAVGAVIVAANAVATKGRSLATDIRRPTLFTHSKHVRGGDGFRKDAGIQPDDFEEVYNNSIEYKGNYWGRSSDGKSIYRYSGRGNSRHWSGSTGDKTNPLTRDRVPDPVLKELGFSAKGKNSPWK